MLLSDLNRSVEADLDKLLTDLNKVGLKNFFKNKDAIKKQLKLKDKDIQELMEESYQLCEHRQWEQALEAILYLIVFNPTQPFQYIRLGTVLLQTKRYEDAIHVFQMAVFLNPKDPRPLLYAGECFLELHRIKEAKKAFAAALEASKGQPQYKDVFDMATQAIREVQHL